MNVFNSRLKYWLLVLNIFLSIVLVAQDTTSKFSDNSVRKYTLYTAGVYTVSMVGLNQLWYKDYPQSKFHWFNDNNQWNQVDKVGHIYSAYVLSRFSSEILNGVDDKKKKLLIAGGSSFLFLSTIEVFDGFSREWGFSIGDVLANTTGVGLYTLQEYYLGKQYVKVKYSYHNTSYRNKRPELLGENTLEGAFKDYNGQTYWASINLNNLYSRIKPKWLSIAFGYGANGMISADTDNLDQSYRQYYLSLDIDFDKIKTNNKLVRSVFTVLDCIKMPLPAIEFNQGLKTNLKGIYF